MYEVVCATAAALENHKLTRVWDLVPFSVDAIKSLVRSRYIFYIVRGSCVLFVTGANPVGGYKHKTNFKTIFFVFR